jgi:hypothetical protein
MQRAPDDAASMPVAGGNGSHDALSGMGMTSKGKLVGGQWAMGGSGRRRAVVVEDAVWKTQLLLGSRLAESGRGIGL